MSEPVKLQVATVEDECKRQVVELLEQFLADAKAGKFDSILIVADHAASEQMEWGWSRCEDLVGLVGRLERMKYTALQRMEVR